MLDRRLLLSLCLVCGCGSESPKAKVVVPLDSVPVVVREAARKAFPPGYTLDSARTLKRDGRDAFEIKARDAQGKIREVELTAEGAILVDDDD